MDKTVFSFPGLGIGEHTMNQVAFTVPIFGGLEVRWYGVILLLGIIAGFAHVMWRCKYEGISTDDVLDFTLITVIMAIFGARFYYVVTTFKYGMYHSFLDVIAIWEGGIAIYGAVSFGALSLFLVSRYKKYDRDKMWRMFDMTAPGVLAGQAIGRWGNFVNGEAHGIETSENFFLRMGLREYGVWYYYHPTFLYESLWNLIGVILLIVFYKKKKFNGQITLMYLAWYGFGRMFIEGLRTDSLYVGVFRVSQVVGFLCFVICTAALVWLLVRARRRELDQKEYQPVYENAKAGLHTPAKPNKGKAAVKTEENTEEGMNEKEASDDGQDH